METTTFDPHLENAEKTPNDLASQPDRHLKPENLTEEEGGDSPKAKTSLRFKYEAEASVIRKQTGELEEIRMNLGLSRRKMCQLLMVDPSSWTRWTRGEVPAPPHIYRALQWYLALIDKNPQWHPQNSFSPVLQQVNLAKIDEVKSSLERRLAQINSEKQTTTEKLESFVQRWEQEKISTIESALAGEKISFIWKFLLLVNTGLLLYLMFS